MNELGRRLDYQVKNGNYQGTPNRVGFDGIWVSPENQTVVVEVKTTDAYRISLDTLARYRDELRKGQEITPPCSILIVVGREDTGELEAQVRGSRHAWDMRLLSTDALSKLVEVKESTDEVDTGRKIREILMPIEYTKLDTLIETIFVAAKDAARSVISEPQQTEETVPAIRESKGKSGWEFTDSALVQTKRETIIAVVGSVIGVKLVKRSRAMYWDAGHEARIICTISKRYDRSDSQRYWYAYHPKWNEFLSEGKSGYFVLGCMDLEIAFIIPVAEMGKHLNDFNATAKEDAMYWHIVIAERSKGKYGLVLPKVGGYLDLTPFAIASK